MTIETLAHADSLEQLSSCEDYNHWLAEQESFITEDTLDEMAEYFNSFVEKK